MGLLALQCKITLSKMYDYIFQGQEWMDDVRLCLMDQLLHSSVYADNSSCKELSTFAYSTHPFCYVDNGFCEVVLPDEQNLNALFSTVSVKDLVWPPDATKAICDILKQCLENESNAMAADNNRGLSGIVPKFLTWLAQLATKYPILNKLACFLFTK